MIQNVPYLNKITPEIINHILYLLKPKRYEAGTRIIKRGDNLDSIYFLKSGIIDVYVQKFEDDSYYAKANDDFKMARNLR